MRVLRQLYHVSQADDQGLCIGKMENAKVDGKSLYPANSMDYAELKK